MNNKPKVGILTRPIDQGTSGSGSHLKQLLEKVIELNNNRNLFNISLIHYKKNDKDIYNNADEVIISRNPIKSSYELKKYDFDIIHYSPLTIFSPLFFHNSKKVATLHGSAPIFIPEQYSKIKVLHEKHFKPLYARKMDYIFTVSEKSKEFLIDYYKIDPKRIKITYNAVKSIFQKKNDISLDVLEKFKIKEPFIFHLSKFSQRKNPWTILESFKVLKKEKCEMKLVLAGKGWENSEVISFAKKNNIYDDIIFPGFIKREEIVDLLNLATVFVFPSFYEGCGMPNLEAMACGCPVITSNSFAIPEMVGDAALILDNKTDANELAIKIKEVNSNRDLRNKLIERGLKRADDFSWEKSAELVLETYIKLTSEEVV